MHGSWIWHLCSHLILRFSRTLGKLHSCFWAPHCVLDSLEYLENLFILPSHHRKKENLGVVVVGFFPLSCANFLFSPVSLSPRFESFSVFSVYGLYSSSLSIMVLSML